MANYSDERRIEHRALVRQAMAIKPRASLTDIVNIVFEAGGYVLDRNYINNIREKIYQERKHQFDDAEINARIAEMQEKLQLVQSEMFKILTNPIASPKDRARAGEVIVKAEKTLIEAQMDAGIFERKLGTLEIDEDAGEDQAILDAMFNMGMISDAEVVDVIPKQINAPTLKKKSAASASGTQKKIPKKSGKAGV